MASQQTREPSQTPAPSTSAPQTGNQNVQARHAKLQGMSFAEQEQSLAPPVQMKGRGGETDVHAAAARGTSGGGSSLPHLDAVQKSFGSHDVGSVQAHVGGKAAEASESMGAEAYATGNAVAFRDTPDLHTTAHEAAHVVQQRAGVSLVGGVGQSGDAYEQQADKVADAVVQGKSAEGLLGDAKGSGSSTAVQKEESKGTPKKGLTLTGGGLLSDWSVAVTTVAQKWNRIAERQQAAAGDFYEKAKEDDPPPAWVGILKAAITIGLGAVTGGVGALIVSKFVTPAASALTNFIVNSAVEAGKGLVSTASSAAMDAATANDSSDGLLAYKIAQQDAIGQVVDRESEVTALNMDKLTKLDEDKRWGGMQDIYNGLESSRTDAYNKQYGETLEGWFSALAKQSHGTNTKGTTDVADDTTKVSDMDKEDTSLTGVLGLRLKAASDPTKRLAIDYVQIEGSKGNNEKTRSYFLNSPKKVKDFRMPKNVLAQGMPTAGRWAFGSFFAAWDEAGSWSATTYGGASIDDSNDNAGRSWVAMYGMNVNRDLSEGEVNANFSKGIAQIERDILGRSFKDAGVTKITT